MLPVCGIRRRRGRCQAHTHRLQPRRRPRAAAVDSPVVSRAVPLPPVPAPDAPKATWRSWARAARRLHHDPERDRRVVEGLLVWPAYRRARTVLLYLAFGSEVDLTPLTRDAERLVLVPRSRTTPAPELSLHRLRGAVLERHPMGPLQPRPETPEVDPSAVELAVLPGLCFDRKGGRLGYGRGYFDRFLRRLSPGVPRVGVSYDALVVDALPREPHDEAVTHLATESGVRPVRVR